MKKAILGVVVVIVIAAGVYTYFYSKNIPCYDGYGSGRYVTKDELTTILAKNNETDLSKIMGSIDAVAIEYYRCSDRTYTVKNGNEFKEVSKTDFQKFIDAQTGEMYKVTQSGNSPWFVNDVTTGKQYFINQKDGRYNLEDTQTLYK